MTYLFVGEKDLIEKFVNEIREKEKIDNNSISRYDLDNCSIRDAIDDINTFSLFDNKKMIIVYSFDKITDSDILVSYLKNQNDNILVLISFDKLNDKLSYVKELKKNCSYKECFKYDVLDYIKESLKDYKISFSDMLLLKDYVDNNYNRALNEVEKLKLYKQDDKVINRDDIKLVVSKSFDGNIFSLIDAVNKKDKVKVFSIFYELVNNDDEIKIISILANNYRLIYKIKVLCKDMLDDDVIKRLKIHPYRFKLLKEQGYNYTEDDVLNYLKELSELDIKIKSGAIDKRLGMELFLSKI